MSGGSGEIPEEGGGSGNVFGEEASEGVDLNLTALMDILSNLLFFLLACFGATIVMGINATVPVQSSKSDLSDTSQTVTVGVGLSKGGFDVTAIGAAQSPVDLDKWHRQLPLRDGSPDYEALAKHLFAIKQQYPKSDTMILTPEDGISYAIMIKTMDTARESDVELAGLKRAIPLFPTVVVSTVVK